MAIQSPDSIATRRTKVAKLKGSNRSGRRDTDENSRVRALESTVVKLVKRIATLENKIKVMVKVTRDRNGKETIIVKE
tara:strand:+ start:1802 stop:2035 length:234 start_codon:yes stop_codon:yes gene_type:complete